MNNDEDNQMLLFSEQKINDFVQTRTFQIKRTDDTSFQLNMVVSINEENPEALALEKLGYFIIPEIPLNF